MEEGQIVNSDFNFENDEEKKRKDEKVRAYLMSHTNDFPKEKIQLIKDKMMACSESVIDNITYQQLKNPTIGLVLSLLLGGWGIDRFYAGDIGLGVGKLLTGGGCGIWAIVDWFLIMNSIREKNFQSVMQLCTI